MGFGKLEIKVLLKKISATMMSSWLIFIFQRERIRTELMNSNLILKSSNSNTTTTSNRRIKGLSYSYMSFCPQRAKVYLERVEFMNNKKVGME